jgi:hypothetical protein
MYPTEDPMPSENDCMDGDGSTIPEEELDETGS